MLFLGGKSSQNLTAARGLHICSAGMSVVNCSRRMNTIETKDEEYNPCSFSKVMQTLDELHKQLDEVKHHLNESSMESLLLNAELVCMFDPIKLDELEGVVFECNDCAARVEQRQKQAIQLLNRDAGTQDRK